VALGVFALGFSSVTQPRFPVVSKQNVLAQQSNNPISITPTASHTIFLVDGITITDAQWHDAVKSAFEVRASTGQYQGGTQTDTVAINTQAMHTVLDPIAEQEIIKELGLTTNLDALYQQWLIHASPQEKQTAQQSQDNMNYKQQIAQEQLLKNIVVRLAALPSPGLNDVYTYYLQHSAKYARTAPQMHLQQIVVTSPQAVQDVVNQLNQGISFSTVEAAYDVSGSFYHAQGGDLGWIAVGGSGYPPEWSFHVIGLKAGQVGVPFQVDNRYFIVKCLEGPDYEPWPFSQVQDQAKHDWALEQLNNAFAHILSQKERSMHITLLDPRYGEVLQQFQASFEN
jgi:parvulin-like peptidyl-prolyl isomerase